MEEVRPPDGHGIPGSASYVEDSRFRNKDDFLSAGPEPPAQVELFMEGKKAFIESPHYADVPGPSNERGPTRPEDLAGCIILAHVSLDLVKNPPAAPA